MDNTKNSMTVSEFLSGETTLDKLKIGTGGIIKQVGGEKDFDTVCSTWTYAKNSCNF